MKILEIANELLRIITSDLAKGRPHSEGSLRYIFSERLSIMQGSTNSYASSIITLLNYNLFVLGDAKITPLSIIYIILLAGLLIYLSGKLKHILISKLLVKLKLDIGAQQAIGGITRYIVLFVGFLIILQTVGINLTTLNVLAGAVGIGIGFGLQNIANNFISGLIILLERPIKVGDRVEVQGITGRVQSVSARSTIIRTNDNISIIVPNSKFISEHVVNWSFASNTVRFRIPLMVSYDSDVDLVKKVLTEVASESADILEDPPPSTSLVRFDEKGMFFELRAWSRTRVHNPGSLRSDLNYEIFRRFRENGIKFAESHYSFSMRETEADDFTRVRGGGNRREAQAS